MCKLVVSETLMQVSAKPVAYCKCAIVLWRAGHRLTGQRQQLRLLAVNSMLSQGDQTVCEAANHQIDEHLSSDVADYAELRIVIVVAPKEFEAHHWTSRSRRKCEDGLLCWPDGGRQDVLGDCRGARGRNWLDLFQSLCPELWTSRSSAQLRITAGRGRWCLKPHSVT